MKEINPAFIEAANTKKPAATKGCAAPDGYVRAPWQCHCVGQWPGPLLKDSRWPKAEFVCTDCDGTGIVRIIANPSHTNTSAS